jgi:hypothetical protein
MDSPETLDGLLDEAEPLTAKEVAQVSREIALASRSAPRTETEWNALLNEIPAETDDPPAPTETASVTETAPADPPWVVLPRIKRNLILERLRAEKAAREVKPGVMPLCIGLTMREVLELMGRSGIKFQLEGAGLATRQEPAAGVRLVDGQEAGVVFSMPSERIKQDASAGQLSEQAGLAPRG